jgi:hypothetical protein
MQRIVAIAALVLSASAWSAETSPSNAKSVEIAAHGAYLFAINSNDTETLMADLTDECTEICGCPLANGVFTDDLGLIRCLIHNVDGWSSDMPAAK